MAAQSATSACIGVARRVRGSAGRLFIRFLYHMYCLHKTVNTKAVNKDICVRVIGKVSSYSVLGAVH